MGCEAQLAFSTMTYKLSKLDQTALAFFFAFLGPSISPEIRLTLAHKRLKL